MRGEGIENPYRVTPVTTRVPVGMRYSHRISLVNPHPETLIVKEVSHTWAG